MKYNKTYHFRTTPSLANSFYHLHYYIQYIQFPTQKVYLLVPDVYYNWQRQTALLSPLILAAYTNSTNFTPEKAYRLHSSTSL